MCGWTGPLRFISWTRSGRRRAAMMRPAPSREPTLPHRAKRRTLFVQAPYEPMAADCACQGAVSGRKTVSKQYRWLAFSGVAGIIVTAVLMTTATMSQEKTPQLTRLGKVEFKVECNGA